MDNGNLIGYQLIPFRISLLIFNIPQYTDINGLEFIIFNFLELLTDIAIKPLIEGFFKRNIVINYRSLINILRRLLTIVHTIIDILEMSHFFMTKRTDYIDSTKKLQTPLKINKYQLASS